MPENLDHHLGRRLHPQVMSDWIMCVCVLLYLLSPSKPSPMSYLSEICPVGLHYYKYYNNINFYIISKPSLLLTVRQLSCIVSEKLALAGSRTRVSKGIRPGVLTTRPPVPGRHNSASAHSQFFSLRLPDSAADTVQCQQC